MVTSEVDQGSFEVPESTRVAHELRAPEFHWHFSQGLRAVDAELYVPGVLCLLAGIEASIRFTLRRLESRAFPFNADLGTVLSNALLREADKAGIPIQSLAFAGETDFASNLLQRQPEVRIVKVRNDLAHGNVQAFVNRDLGDDLAFFTPECLRPLAVELRAMSLRWAKELALFRSESGLV